MKLCSIASGSSGNCIYAGSESTHILIDAGISGKRIETGLNSIGLKSSEIAGVLISHEHSDHISSLGVLARRYGMPIYATGKTIEAILQKKTVGKIPNELFKEIKADENFTIDDLEIRPFSISHDAAEPVAFVVLNGDKKIGIATDLGNYDDYTIDKLQGLDVLLLEANHDINMLQVGSYPYPLKRRILSDRGHLSNERSGRLLCEILHDKMKHIFLGHLSKENNYAQLAFETVCLEVTLGDNPYKASDFHIQVANREVVSELVVF